MNSKWTKRFRNEPVFKNLIGSGTPPFVAHMVATRVSDIQAAQNIIRFSPTGFPPPEALADCDRAAKRIVDAIRNNEPIGFLTDYDCDGICAYAVIQGALIHFDHLRFAGFIGNRFDDGYGITPPMVQRVLSSDRKPTVLITADCGSSDEEQIRVLASHGIEVIVTDHHVLPDHTPPPSAYAVVNPQRKDCSFPYSGICGCAVAYLLMSRVRTLLAHDKEIPPLHHLLGHVGLATAADMVPMSDPLNRFFITAGLKVINSEPSNQTRIPICWTVFRNHLKKEGPLFFEDLGFQLSPRINAVSRLGSPKPAIDFLTAVNPEMAEAHCKKIDALNQNRKDIEAAMFETASESVSDISDSQASITIGHNRFHVGVTGILASRLVKTFGRPALVLAPYPSNQDFLVGSARSLNGFSVIEAFNRIHSAAPDLLIRYGGHKNAGGFQINRKDVQRLRELFETEARDRIQTDGPPGEYYDGVLKPEKISLETWSLLSTLHPFGVEFETPIFRSAFEVKEVRKIGKNGGSHFNLKLAAGSHNFDAVWFNAPDIGSLPGAHRNFFFELSENRWKGKVNMQLLIKGAE